MDLESVLKEYRSVKGYLGSGITTYTSDVIAGDVADPSINLPLIAALTNDVLMQVHEVAQKYANTTCEETHIFGTDIVVLMRCTGPHAKAHLHLGCVLKADGNTALARMLMEKIALKVVDMV